MRAHGSRGLGLGSFTIFGGVGGRGQYNTYVLRNKTTASASYSNYHDSLGHMRDLRRLKVPVQNNHLLDTTAGAGNSSSSSNQVLLQAHSGKHSQHNHQFHHKNNSNGSAKKHLDEVITSASASASASTYSTTALGVDTELGKDLSSVSNQQLSQFRALVLDVSYRPIDTLPWTRAIVLDFFDKVDVLEYYDSFVRSARDYHYLPAVVRVKFYVKKLQGAFDRGVPLTRKNVYARDEHSCQYCGSKSNLTLDHVIPVSKGGGTTWDNIVCACNKCNQKKGDKLLKQCKHLNMRS